MRSCSLRWGACGGLAAVPFDLRVLTGKEITMPAKSKAQQKAAGAALAAKRGETAKGELKGASRSMYESMNEQQLEDFAGTRRKGKPEHARS